MENSWSGFSIPKKTGSKWYFKTEELECTPSRKCGISQDKELWYRQQSASFIQDIGCHVHVNLLCINTAIVFMHRFYMHHSFSHFHRNDVSPAALFLATKVEEQPRKLEHVIKAAYLCLHRDSKSPIDTASSKYSEWANKVATTENVILMTLAFEMTIRHPHTDVASCCQKIKACRELSNASYFLATQSLHLTTFCLQYNPKLVACVCIHFACKWCGYKIPLSKEGLDWFLYVDATITIEQLENLTNEFLAIMKKSPTRFKNITTHLNQYLKGNNSHTSYLAAQPNLSAKPNLPAQPNLSAKLSLPAQPNLPAQPKITDLSEKSSCLPKYSSLKITHQSEKSSTDFLHRVPRDPQKTSTCTSTQIIATRRDSSVVFSADKYYSRTEISCRNDVRLIDQSISMSKEFQPLKPKTELFTSPVASCPSKTKTSPIIDSLIRSARKRKLYEQDYRSSTK